MPEADVVVRVEELPGLVSFLSRLVGLIIRCAMTWEAVCPVWTTGCLRVRSAGDQRLKLVAYRLLRIP